MSIGNAVDFGDLGRELKDQMLMEVFLTVTVDCNHQVQDTAE